MDFFVFQDVFPGDFGPTYDKAIQTLMWLFLSRLEKLIPTQTLQQVHLMYHFGNTSSHNEFLCFSELHAHTIKTDVFALERSCFYKLNRISYFLCFFTYIRKKDFHLTLQSFCLTLVFCLCQIAALLSNASSVLTECMETFGQPQELKTLLDTQKDLSQLEDIGEVLRITMTYSQNIIDIKCFFW